MTTSLQYNISCIRSSCQPYSFSSSPFPLLIAVTKSVSFELIPSLLNYNISHIGESRIQDAFEKYRHLKDLPFSWHMIGHLQKNKAKKMVEIFDTWHTLDSVDTARIVHEHCSKLNKTLPAFVQVNIGCDPNKYGIFETDLRSTLLDLSQFPFLQIVGLMTLLPLHVASPASLFQKMYQLAQQYYQEGLLLHPYLSMGMSSDYIEALRCGATHIRIGRALFSS